MQNSNRKILLDSGAYSARKAGKIIDINEYMRFVKNHNDLFHRYFNLDVINEELTSQQKGERSLNNYNTMRDKDLNPVPVFHHGSDLSILDYYKKNSNSDYIGLGNISDKDKERIPYLDYMFHNHLGNSSVHGFGVASFDLLLRSKYTWASVDSTKYIKEASFGKILVPYYDGNQFLYADDRCDKFFVTERSAQEYDKKERHYKYVRNADRGIIDLYLKEECGTTIGELEKFKPRLLVNAMFYQKLEAQLQYPIYLSVTMTNNAQREVAIELKVKNVLVSYYFFMNDYSRFFSFYKEYSK